MNKHILPPLLIATFVLYAATPLNASTMTLKECVLGAIKNSPGLASQHHLIEASVEGVTKKRATTLPFLSSQIQGYELNGRPVTPWVPTGLSEPENPFGRHDAHWAPVTIQSIGITYPIINEGSLFGLNDAPVVSAARAQVAQEQSFEVLSEQKLVFDVVSDFIYAASYRQQVTTYDLLLELSQKQLDIANEQMRLGHELPQSVDILQSKVAALESARSALAQNASNFVADLAGRVEGQIQGAGDPLIQIDDVLPPLAPLPALRQFLDQVMPRHPALRVEATKVEIARQQLRVDEASRWPTASITTSFAAAQDLNYFSGNNTNIRPTAFQSYLTVIIPLYDFGGRRAAVSESRENAIAGETNLRQVDLDIRSSITQAYGAILQEVATIAMLESGLERDTGNLKLAKAQLSEGKIDQMSFLNADIATLQDTLAVEQAEMSQRLRYAELQNLSAGAWHWAP
jgi:outer membrane protein TolC